MPPTVQTPSQNSSFSLTLAAKGSGQQLNQASVPIHSQSWATVLIAGWGEEGPSGFERFHWARAAWAWGCFVGEGEEKVGDGGVKCQSADNGPSKVVWADPLGCSVLKWQELRPSDQRRASAQPTTLHPLPQPPAPALQLSANIH